MSETRLRLVVDDAVVEVDTAAGGRISRLELDGEQLLVGPTDDPIGWGCYPMAPWAGRVGDARFDWDGQTFELEPTMPPHAIHGTALRRPWRVLDETSIATDLGPGWPFAGEVVQRFTLVPGSLTVELELRATTTRFPATVGWHPWFRRVVAGNEAQLDFRASSMYERGPDHLPTGRLVEPSAGPWDDAFTGLDGPANIRWGDRIALTIESDLDHLMVYDEQPHALCIEPQSGPPNPFALRSAAIVEPDEPLEAAMVWTWSLGR